MLEYFIISPSMLKTFFYFVTEKSLSQYFFSSKNAFVFLVLCQYSELLFGKSFESSLRYSFEQPVFFSKVLIMHLGL